MNRFRALLVVAVAAFPLALPPQASAEDGWVEASFTPFQLSIAAGMSQIFKKKTPVYGMRLSALYGEQSKVVGLDAGLFNDTDELTGLEIGFCNVVRENARGAQIGGACSQSEGDLKGLQIGLYNQVAGQISGAQLGFANVAETGSAFQLGLWNRATKMRGIQFGLLNFNEDGFLPFFPLLNFGF